jgi:hypothetical protein
MLYWTVDGIPFKAINNKSINQSFHCLLFPANLSQRVWPKRELGPAVAVPALGQHRFELVGAEFQCRSLPIDIWTNCHHFGRAAFLLLLFLLTSTPMNFGLFRGVCPANCRWARRGRRWNIFGGKSLRRCRFYFMFFFLLLIFYFFRFCAGKMHWRDADREPGVDGCQGCAVDGCCWFSDQSAAAAVLNIVNVKKVASLLAGYVGSILSRKTRYNK